MLVYALAIGVAAMGLSVSASASVSTQRRASDFDSTTTATATIASSIPLSGTHQMHPMEDPTSWELHMGRRKAQQQQHADTSNNTPPRRFLQTAAASVSASTGSSNFELLLNPKSTNGDDHKIDEEDDNDCDNNDDNDDNDDDDDVWTLPFKVKHKRSKDHIPFAGGDTTHGIMIDAGSVSIVRLFVPQCRQNMVSTAHSIRHQPTCVFFLFHRTCFGISHFASRRPL
jgi:hypothetical protein